MDGLSSIVQGMTESDYGRYPRSSLPAALLLVVAAFTAPVFADGVSLPDGYMRLAYIESTSRQCIYTGYIPTWGDRIECDVKVSIPYGSAAYSLFGKGAVDGSNKYYFQFQPDATQGMVFGNTVYYHNNGGARGGEFFRTASNFLNGYDNAYLVHVTMQTNIVEWTRHDGTYYGFCAGPADAAAAPAMDKELCIFGVNNNAANKWTDNPTTMRLYSFKVTAEDGTPRCDFIPCYRHSDGEVGLYDVERGLFKANESTDAVATGRPFKAGPIYGALPDGFRKAKYIQSTAPERQYIDTGYLHGTNDLVAMDYYAPKSWQVNGYCHVFGSWAGGSKYTSAENFWFYIGGNGADNISYNHYTSKNGKSTAVGYDYTKDPMHLEAQASTARLSCGSYAISITTTGTYANWTDGKYPLYIFSSNAGGSVYSDTTIMRLYSFKIYRDIDGENVLVHDFIPCVAASGKAGLYDLVGDRFHGNARSGVENFLYEVEEPTLPEGYTAAKYIQSTSALQYINTLYWHGTNDLVAMDYHAPKTWQANDYCYLWGSRMPSSGNHTHAVNWSFYIGGKKQDRVNYNHYSSAGNNNPSSSIYNYADDPIHLECQASTAKWTCGGITNSFTTTATFSNWVEGRWPLFIFTGDCGGTPEYGYSSVMRLYSFKIYREFSGNMAPVRDFVPCVEEATGRAGLYDLIGGRFHGNARAGVEDFKWFPLKNPTMIIFR